MVGEGVSLGELRVPGLTLREWFGPTYQLSDSFGVPINLLDIRIRRGTLGKHQLTTLTKEHETLTKGR